MKRNYGIFRRISERVGADMDKIIFENDEVESKKLERHLNKETMKLRTRLIEEQVQQKEDN